MQALTKNVGAFFIAKFRLAPGLKGWAIMACPLPIQGGTSMKKLLNKP